MSYENHYKDRDPIDTIKIIKDFFKDKGFKITEENLESESSTWSCHLALYKNNHFIISSNGKGLNKEFSLASGYAELYERFCNGCHFINNPFLNKIIFQHLKDKNGYIFHKDEKYNISFEESINSPSLINFYNLLGNVKNYFETIYENFIGVPYQEINTEEIKYFDPRLLQRYDATGGMATGNTLLEALNQGISELYEHHVLNNFFISEFSEYYALDLNSINDNKLSSIINNIKENNNQFFLLDLSYNFNMPVFCGIIYNSYSQTIYCNFGAFPVAEIAIERVLTELYQNIYSFNITKPGFLKPFDKTAANKIVFDGGGKISGVNTFPEFIFERIKYISQPNETIYLNKKQSNSSIFQYYKNLSKQLGLNFYYTDKSLSNDMKCVHIFSEGLDTTLSGFFIEYNNISYKNKILNLLIEKYNLITNFLNQPTEDIKFEIIRNIQDIDYLIKDKISGSYLALLYGSDWLSIYSNLSTGSSLTEGIILNLLNTSQEVWYLDQFVCDNFIPSAYYSDFKRVLTHKLFNQEKMDSFTIIDEVIFTTFLVNYKTIKI